MPVSDFEWVIRYYEQVGGEVDGGEMLGRGACTACSFVDQSRTAADGRGC